MALMLDRGLSAAQIAQFSGVFYPVTLVYLDWPSGPVRAHSGTGNLRYNGADWTGVGRFGALELPDEASGMAATTGRLTLVGDPATLLAELGPQARQRAVRIMAGTLTSRAGGDLACDPVEVFAGYIDAATMSVQLSDGVVTHTASVELGVGPGQRSAVSVFHTFEDQQSRHPGDTAGRHVARALDNAAKFTWPES